MRFAAALLLATLATPASAAPRLDVDLDLGVDPVLVTPQFRPTDAVELKPAKRFAAGFVVEGVGTTSRPMLEVCGPEVTLSIRFGGPKKP